MLVLQVLLQHPLETDVHLPRQVDAQALALLLQESTGLSVSIEALLLVAALWSQATKVTRDRTDECMSPAGTANIYD